MTKTQEFLLKYGEALPVLTLTAEMLRLYDKQIASNLLLEFQADLMKLLQSQKP